MNLFSLDVQKIIGKYVYCSQIEQGILELNLLSEILLFKTCLRPYDSCNDMAIALDKLYPNYALPGSPTYWEVLSKHSQNSNADVKLIGLVRKHIDSIYCPR